MKKEIILEKIHLKPGTIKYGTTTVKLSNTRDPWRKRYGCDIGDEDELSDEQSDDSAEDDDDSSEWVWADEEEYTLGHVWITGIRADRGIIYVGDF